MSSYNPPTELLPRFNTKVFIQNANVSYPVAQGAITIPNQITIVNGSNTIIITPTSIIINGNPFSFANIAYLNLNQTFTGINTFTQKIIGFLDTNTPSVSITQFSSLTTGTLYIAPTITTGNINIGCSSIDSITGIGNGNINIGNCRSFAGSLKLGNLFNNSYLNGAIVYIGNSLSTSYIYGSVNIGSSGVSNFILGDTTINNTLTNAINPVTSTSILQIATNNSTANVIIASGTTGNVSLGGTYVTTLYLFGQSVVIGVALSGNSITLSTDTSCNGIFTAQTIRATTLSSPVKLFDNSTGTITFGNSSATITINGNTTFPDGINVKTIRTANATDSVALYDTTTGAITFGNSSSSATTTFSTNTNFTKTNTFLSIFTTAIDNLSLNNNVNLYSYPTTATINLCKGLTTGNFILCGNTSFAGTITIGGNSGTNTIKGNTIISNTLLVDTLTSISASDTINLYTSSTGTISLATTNNVINVGTSSNGTINIGSTSSTNTISGYTTISNQTITNTLIVNAIQGKSVSDNVFVYNDNTTGTITLGGSNTNNINIGSSTGAISLKGSITYINGTMTGDNIQPNNSSSIVSLYTSPMVSLTIGNNTTSTTTIKGYTNKIYGDTTMINSILVDSVKGSLTTTSPNLYIDTTGTITIGKLSSLMTINPNTTINGNVYFNNLQGVSPANNISLYTLSTGTLTLGSTSLTSFTINSPSITIGTISVSSTTLNGTLIVPNQLKIKSIEATATTDSVSLYTTLSNVLIIGSSSLNTLILNSQNLTISGNVLINYILTDTISGKLVGDTITLYGTTTTGNINFATGLSTGTLTIGNSSATNTINGNTTISNTLYTNTISSIVSTDTANLYTSTQGALNIGNVGSVTTINGQYTAVNGSILLNTSNILYANTIRTYTTTDNIALYNNTTGTLTIGNTSSSSAVYLRGSNIVIGNTSGGQTKIYNIITNSIEPITTTNNCILYSTATGNLTLGGSTTTYTNIYGQNIGIGNSGSLNTITGNTTISNTLLANTLTGVLASDNISLYNTSTTGNISFATGITSGSINIGNPSQSGTTSIYSSTSGISNLFTNSTTGSINIGSPTSTTFISNIGGKNVITNTSVSSISTSTSGLSFKNICMSGNGEIAYIFSGSNLYRTSNSGASWVLQHASGGFGIIAICCSYTGQFVYYAMGGTSPPRYSNNFGQTFTTTTGLTTQGTQHTISCSSDGSIFCIIFPVSVSSKFVPYFNTTYGVGSTWNAGYPLTSSSSSINSALIIGSLGSISNVIVATGKSSYNDYIYYSTTPTTSWTQSTITGTYPNIWTSLSYSAGGASSAIIYASSGLTGSSGGLYLSSNNGASFISLSSTSGSINWVSSSYDNTIISYVSSTGFSLSTNSGLNFTSYSTTSFSYMAMSQSSKNVLLVPTSITDAIYQFNTNQNLNVNCDFIIPKQRMTLQSNTEDNYGNNTNVFYPYRTMFLGLSSSNNATLTYPLYENYIMTPQGASVITLPALKEYSVGLKLTFTKIALQTLNFTTTSPDLLYDFGTATGVSTLATPLATTITSVILMSSYNPSSTAQFCWCIVSKS